MVKCFSFWEGLSPPDPLLVPRDPYWDCAPGPSFVVTNDLHVQYKCETANSSMFATECSMLVKSHQGGTHRCACD